MSYKHSPESDTQMRKDAEENNLSAYQKKSLSDQIRDCASAQFKEVMNSLHSDEEKTKALEEYVTALGNSYKEHKPAKTIREFAKEEEIRWLEDRIAFLSHDPNPQGVNLATLKSYQGQLARLRS